MSTHTDPGRQHLLNLLAANTSPRFLCTYCSQCGADLGPGDDGVSHCRDHIRSDDSDCPECLGTGEGAYDGAACRGCRGSGSL